MKRYGFRLKVKKGYEEQYIYQHKKVLPGLIEALKEAGIGNYSIFMDGVDLFAYLECEDIEQSWAKIASHPAQAEWGIIMTPIMDLVEPGDAEPRMKPILEVFHLD